MLDCKSKYTCLVVSGILLKHINAYHILLIWDKWWIKLPVFGRAEATKPMAETPFLRSFRDGRSQRRWLYRCIRLISGALGIPQSSAWWEGGSPKTPMSSIVILGPHKPMAYHHGTYHHFIIFPTQLTSTDINWRGIWGKSSKFHPPCQAFMAGEDHRGAETTTKSEGNREAFGMRGESLLRSELLNQPVWDYIYLYIYIYIYLYTYTYIPSCIFVWFCFLSQGNVILGGVDIRIVLFRPFWLNNCGHLRRTSKNCLPEV